ncbi:MAG: hypothetical protein ACP5SH_22830 [Syntrophobacteraceae bacterium]
MKIYMTWIGITSLSVLVSVAVFIVSVKSGQFANQERARFLPLSEEHFAPLPAPPAKSRAQRFALLVILALGVSVIVSPFLVLLFK